MASGVSTAAIPLSTRYSPLDQIDSSNVAQLQVVWRWRGTNFGPRPQTNTQVTPLMVNGVLYFTAGSTRTVVAVDAGTGETLWVYRIQERDRGVVRDNNRGVAYWLDLKGPGRILVVSGGYQLIALDAVTGHVVEGFGRSGYVDLWVGLDRDGRVPPATIGATSPPIIIRDVAVVGAAFDDRPVIPVAGQAYVPGYIRGYDVRTGKLRWTFRTVPRSGEPGVETWENESWTYTGNTGAWAPMSADEELGYVYVATEAPTGNTYGALRPGHNLFSDSIVCLDARTGKRIWHFQLIHHDIWDWDIPAAPMLLDVTIDGRPRKVVAVITKQAFTYVFDRVTGEPIWPIVERSVPQSDVPGERTAPTQPFPTKPPPFDYQGYSEDYLADFTPAIRAAARATVARFRLGPMFTPPILEGTGGKEATLQVPGSSGAISSNGAAVDPETGHLYVPSVTTRGRSSLRPHPDRPQEVIDARDQGVPTIDGLGVPLFKPPYGRITAIDLKTGTHAWIVPNRQVIPFTQNNAALKAAGIDAADFGAPITVRLLATKTLLLSAGMTFHALDKRTGRELHRLDLPTSPVEGGLMTYMHAGRQFIVAPVFGREGAELIALALTKPK